MNLKVYIYRRPNMFLVNENLYHMIGYQELRNIFEIESYKSEGNLVLYFPERFLNVVEQRELMIRLFLVGYENVTIVTHSVYIIQCTPSENAKIVDVGESLDDDEFKLSHDSVGLPNDAGLGVCYAER